MARIPSRACAAGVSAFGSAASRGRLCSRCGVTAVRARAALICASASSSSSSSSPDDNDRRAADTRLLLAVELPALLPDASPTFSDTADAAAADAAQQFDAQVHNLFEKLRVHAAASQPVTLAYFTADEYEVARAQLARHPSAVEADVTCTLRGARLYQRGYLTPDPYWNDQMVAGWEIKPALWVMREFFSDALRPRFDAKALAQRGVGGGGSSSGGAEADQVLTLEFDIMAPASSAAASSTITGGDAGSGEEEDSEATARAWRDAVREKMREMGVPLPQMVLQRRGTQSGRREQQQPRQQAAQHEEERAEAGSNQQPSSAGSPLSASSSSSSASDIDRRQPHPFVLVLLPPRASVGACLQFVMRMLKIRHADVIVAGTRGSELLREASRALGTADLLAGFAQRMRSDQGGGGGDDDERAGGRKRAGRRGSVIALPQVGARNGAAQQREADGGEDAQAFAVVHAEKLAAEGIAEGLLSLGVL